MTAPQFTTIRLAAEFLLDSPTNPRVHYDETALQELADSIKSQGLIQPIVARPLSAKLAHEIVCGHRRVRAARLAGLEVIPAIVRNMTEEEAATAQIHENLARVDVSPLEEAEGFDRLIRKYRVPIEQVIKDSGKSRAYVYGRLKLRKLYKPGQEAVASGLATDVAQIIASLPTEALQRKALDDVRGSEWQDGKMVPTGWRSARDAKRILANGRYFIAIAKAPFSPDDATLGGEACTGCAQRTINDPSAEPGADLCTDVSCFEAKTRALYAQQAEQLRAQGHTVLEGDEADAFQPHRYSTPKGFTSLTTGFWIDGDNVLLEDLLAKRPEHVAAPKLTYVVDEDGSLRGFMADADRAALVRAAEQAAGQDSDEDDDTDAGSASADDDDDEAPGAASTPHSPEEIAASTHWPDIKAAILRAAAAAPRTVDDMRYIAAAALDTHDDSAIEAIADAMGWGPEVKQLAEDGEYNAAINWTLQQLPGMDADQLALLVLLLALQCGPIAADDWRKARVAMARHYGVDPLNPGTPEARAEEQPQLDGMPPAEQDDDEDEAAPQPAAKPKANVARYRNPATGETWSGRGLQPKWLKAAIAAGNQLADYAVEAVPA
ncbi:ParB/RepB/Spo0J family partition protein [Roseateles asaccharophilus]|uniref:ParB/RepB/Spo0J family partition protein n=1 Tax=Roseateles asaccharophilus TaxID=582607 RepID=A0ABU2A3G3_9BURK|nr:ParB/RepB/Spo0J family partition protein [Roseateles asaccharophilus]MDR7331733.1 ParB/RepB/Spo0J family partition protein [Roseateles asaccharophilus]